ncbi:MAG: type IV pilus modification protein PilV [Motiliproteus sp.]
MTTTDATQIRSSNREQGFTLIEILVAVLILSLGVLGLIGMESLALKNNMSAYHRSQATILAYDLADKIRANPAGQSNYVSLTGSDIGVSCISHSASDGVPSGCSAAQIAQQDVHDWLGTLSTVLPAGSASISSGTISTITISWDDDRDSTTSAANFSFSFGL